MKQKKTLLETFKRIGGKINLKEFDPGVDSDTGASSEDIEKSVVEDASEELEKIVEQLGEIEDFVNDELDSLSKQTGDLKYEQVSRQVTRYSNTAQKNIQRLVDMLNKDI